MSEHLAKAVELVAAIASNPTFAPIERTSAIIDLLEAVYEKLNELEPKSPEWSNK